MAIFHCYVSSPEGMFWKIITTNDPNLQDVKLQLFEMIKNHILVLYNALTWSILASCFVRPCEPSPHPPGPQDLPRPQGRPPGGQPATRPSASKEEPFPHGSRTSSCDVLICFLIIFTFTHIYDHIYICVCVYLYRHIAYIYIYDIYIYKYRYMNIYIWYVMYIYIYT